MASPAKADRLVARLLRRELVAGDDGETADLIHRLRHVKRTGRFSRSEFLEMCRWKSPRSARQCERNNAAAIRRASRQVLTSRDERRRLELLVRLRGVGVPTASAILTLVDPRRYGVIDIRVWKLLHRIGAVEGRPGGAGFRFADWQRFLEILRRHSRALGVSARRVELTLFEHHRRTRTGRLYSR
jgi:thermostable 8-oxoguanine DNA glycosylase